MPPTDNSTGTRSLKTVSKAAEVLETIKSHGGISVTELSRALDIPKSSAYTQLKTLSENGFVVKQDDEYVLALKFISFGEYVRNQHALYRHGKPHIDELARETEQYAHLVTEENGRGLNLYRSRGDTSVGGDYQNRKLQQPDYLHYTAAGKAILASLPDERVHEIIDQHGLPERTDNTITDSETLFKELAAIRERGYAYNDEEEIRGFRAIGTPIRGGDSKVLGSLSISGPTSYFSDERFDQALPEQVIESANIIEVNITMSGQD
ncbi:MULTISPECIES: IclR family transcriptional regulator [Salinibaculum]|uniref:IclR family transcriptional regulator n=1 Tax=Salinibaculum TaxID=2732368 RepID=UPI0030D2A941